MMTSWPYNDRFCVHEICNVDQVLEILYLASSTRLIQDPPKITTFALYLFFYVFLSTLDRTNFSVPHLFINTHFQQTFIECQKSDTNRALGHKGSETDPTVWEKERNSMWWVPVTSHQALGLDRQTWEQTINTAFERYRKWLFKTLWAPTKETECPSDEGAHWHLQTWAMLSLF